MTDQGPVTWAAFGEGAMMNDSTATLVVNADARRIPLPDQSVQCVVTSPPYWGLRDYGVDDQIGLESTPDEFVAAMVAVFREVRRVLKDNGTLWLNLGDSYGGNRGNKTPAPDSINRPLGLGSVHAHAREFDFRKQLVGIPWRVAFALQSDGWYLRNDIIWHKPNAMPESVKDRPTRDHEYIFLLAKSERYFYDAEAVKEEAQNRGEPDPEKLSRRKRDLARDGNPSRFTRGGGSETGFGSFERRNRRTVWTVPTRPFRGAHFATFPPDLVEPCIKAGSRKGDVVFDPFGSSGTVAATAESLGRYGVVTELNPEYCRMARRRIDRPHCPIASSPGERHPLFETAS